MNIFLIEYTHIFGQGAEEIVRRSLHREILFIGLRRVANAAN